MKNNLKGGKKDENAAFYSNDGKDQKGGSKRKGECHNCGKKGHWTRDCYAEGGGKEGQGPKQKGKGKEKGKGKGKEKEKEKDTAAAAADDKSPKNEDKACSHKDCGEEAWMTVVLDDNKFLSDEYVLDGVSDNDSDDLDIDSDSEEAYSCFIEDNTLTFNPLELDSDISTLSDDNATRINDTEVHTSLEYAYLVGTKDSNARNIEVDLYNSGATRHMSGFFHKFINFITVDPVPITAADKRVFQATGKGDIYVNIPNRNHLNSRILLKDVLYAPSMGVTLVSISQIASAGSTVVFTGNFCRIYNKGRTLIGEIKVKGGLYCIYYFKSGAKGYSAQANEVLTVDELHHRLGHVSHERARLLVQKGLVEGVDLMPDDNATICESCESAKGERKSIVKVREGGRCPAIGDEVHSDLWGPAEVESINWKRYYVSFTDDHSRYTNIYFLHSKDETFASYQIYEAWLNTQQNTKIKCLRSDRGG